MIISSPAEYHIVTEKSPKFSILSYQHQVANNKFIYLFVLIFHIPNLGGPLLRFALYTSDASSWTGGPLRLVSHALIISCLNYCSILYMGLPLESNFVQLVQSPAVQAILGPQRRAHVTPLLCDLTIEC